MDVVTLNQIKKLRETMGASNIKQDFGLAIDNLLLNLDGFSKISQGEYIEDYFRVTPVTSLLAGQNLSSNYKVFACYEHHKLALVGYISSRYYAAWIDMADKTVLDVKEITYQSSWQNYSAMYNARSTQKNGVIIEGKLYCFIDRKRYIIYDMDTYELEIKEVPGNFGMGVYGRGLHIVADGENKKLYLVGGTSVSSTTTADIYPSLFGLYELDLATNTVILITQSRIITAMFSNPWDTGHSNYNYFSSVTFNPATNYIEGVLNGNYYQFDVVAKEFVVRPRNRLYINEPQIMRHLTQVTIKDKILRMIANMSNPETTINFQNSQPNLEVFDTDYLELSCRVYQNEPLIIELTEEEDIDLIRINAGSYYNPQYTGNFYIYTYNEAKQQVASFYPSDGGPFMYPSWSSGQVHEKVKYIELRQNSYGVDLHGIQCFKGFKTYYADDTNPTNYTNITPSNNGISVGSTNTRKYYLEYTEPTKLDCILAFSTNYSTQNSSYNPYYLKVEAANDLAGPWTTVLNPTSDNSSLSNKYKFFLSTGGNGYRYYRLYTTEKNCSFYFFPVAGIPFDWNAVNESVTYYHTNNNSYYSSMPQFLANIIFGTYNSRQYLDARRYDSGGTSVAQQYWVEFPVKPISDARYILINDSTNLATRLENNYRIKVKKDGVTSWQDISLHDGVRIDLPYRNFQLNAYKSQSTLYMYELDSVMDIDSVRIEQIPIDQNYFYAYDIRFASKEEVDALGTYINPTIQTNKYWYEYFHPQIDAPVDATNDAYLHTEMQLYRFSYSRNKLIKINKETGQWEELTAYSNYQGIKAPLKQLQNDPAKYILVEQFEGLNSFGLKVYDTITDTLTTLLLPTITNLNDWRAIQCFVDELNQKAYFFTYADGTNQLMEMNFKDDMGIELAGESFAYLKASVDTILSLTFNRQDGSALQTSFKITVDQSLYLVFKNGGKVSVQSGKIFALWGEK